MLCKHEVRAFAADLLADKQRDLMHGIEHADRMLKAVEIISQNYRGKYDEEAVMLGAYFHGPVHYGENPIREWLKERGFNSQDIERVIKITWESQAKHIPDTLEGKLLSDAHTIEGRKSFFILKPLLVGTIIGQTLNETIKFIEDNVIGKGTYYLPETKEYFDEIQNYAKDFIMNLRNGLC